MELKIFLWIALLAFVSTSALADINDNEVEGRYDNVDLDGNDYFDEEIIASNKPNKLFQEEVVEEPIKAAVAPCLGCAIEIDPKNDKINDLAQFAFGEYLAKDSDSDQEKTLIRVLKAKSQVVAGVKYMLDIEVGFTNCTKKNNNDDDGPEDANKCAFDETKPTFICQFHVVEKSWLNTKEVVHSKCLHDNNAEDESTTVTGSDFEYDSLDDIIPLPPTEDTAATDRAPAYSVYEERRKKREADNLFGQLKDVKEDKSVIEDIAKFALSELDRIDEDNNARLLVEIISVKKQTVSGWLYHLKLQVAPSTCEEGPQATLEKCQDKITLPFVICDVKVLLQPWQTVQKKLTQGECTPMKYKKSKKLAKQLFGDKRKKLRSNNEIESNDVLIGGKVIIDPTSEELNELVDFAIDSVDAQSNALHAQKLVRVVYADRQLVSGILTNLMIEVGYTSCRKSPKLDKSQCTIDESRNHQYCNVTIYEQPWLKQKSVKNAKCGKVEDMTEQTTRTKRSLNTLTDSEHDVMATEFGMFVRKYNKQYESAEEHNYRLGIFKENMRKVKLLQDTEQGTAIYGATKFADLTEEEFSQRHLGLKTELRQRMKRKQAKIPQLPKLPDEFDWRHYNIVTPVKNQGMCGSCWAFSVTGNIEGLYALKHSSLQSFSEQELVDCDTLDEGCGGGLPENAYKALEKLGGLETEQNYPYDGKNEKCHFKTDLAKAQVTGFVEVSKNETEMAAWLVKNGPISIGINANAMQFYFGGVSHPWKFLCSPKNLDHGVLIVGYGVHTYPMFNRTLPFWTIKNSWGESFGEEGYYRVYRGDGTCGLNLMATSAVIA